jgi:hypothetical protein
VKSDGSPWWVWGALLCALGCSGAKHAPYIAEGPPGTSLGESGGSSSGAAATGDQPVVGAGGSGDGAGGSGDGTGSNGGDGPPGGGLFNPKDVYYTGYLPKFLASEKSKGGAALLTDPETVIYGFSDTWAGTLWGNDFVYAKGGKIMKFVADKLGQAAAPEQNDVVAATPDCGDQALSSYSTTPGGHLLYTCGMDYKTYYEDGAIIYQGDATPLRIVNDDLALVSGGYVKDVDVRYALLELSTGKIVPISDFPAKIDGISATRGITGGFHAVLDAYPNPRELWEVMSDGSAKKLGAYPELPEIGLYDATALGPDDVHYLNGMLSNSDQVIMSLTLGAAAPKVAYTFGDKSAMYPGNAGLGLMFITGH